MYHSSRKLRRLGKGQPQADRARHSQPVSRRSRSDRWQWFERVVLMMIFLSVVLAVFGFYQEFGNRQEGRIVAAWNLVTTKATGNSGKREALEYLNQEGGWPVRKARVPLVGIDFSCAAMGGEANWIIDEAKHEYSCTNRVYLQKLHLPSANLQDAKFQGADLREADFQSADLRRAEFSGADMRDATLQGADLSNAKFLDALLTHINFENARLSWSEFQAAWLNSANFENAVLWRANFQDTRLGGANFQAANLSGTNFTGAHIDEANFTDVWAWSDLPPVGLEGVDITLCVYDESKGHEPLTRPETCTQANMSQ